MDQQEAGRLLALSRDLRWTFPSSSGNPLRPDENSVDGTLPERRSFAEAARFLADSGDAERATELAANAWRLWMAPPRDPEGGRAFLAAVLEVEQTDPARARSLALYGDGLFAFWLGAHEESRRRNEEALETARACGDPEALTLACLGLSRVALDDGDHERARSLAVEARRHARVVGGAMGQAPLHLHAQAVRLRGDLDEAAALFEESLELNRCLGDPGMVNVELHNLGHVEVRRGNPDAAGPYFEELGTARTHLNDAALAFARGDRELARALLTRAEADEDAGDDRAELDLLRGRLAEARA